MLRCWWLALILGTATSQVWLLSLLTVLLLPLHRTETLHSSRQQQENAQRELVSRTLSQLPLWSLTLAVPSSSQQATSMLGCFTMCRASWCKLRTWRSNWRSSSQPAMTKLSSYFGVLKEMCWPNSTLVTTWPTVAKFLPAEGSSPLLGSLQMWKSGRWSFHEAETSKKLLERST